MPTLNVFDVVLVYNSSSATSASEISKNITSPFRNKIGHNKAYGYFLKVCKLYDLKAALTTSSDIIGPGKFKSYWTLVDKVWIKNRKQCQTNQVFTKFSPTTKEGKALRKLLFSSDKVKPFNNRTIFELFFDKQSTYDLLSKHSIPTVAITSPTLNAIKKTCNKLARIVDNHPHKDDFSDSIIMKDRYGAGGNNIYKFSSNNATAISNTINNNPTLSFIIQPFAKFDKGFSYNEMTNATDIRLIYLNGKIVSCYIRMAKSGDFRCNQHQGGSIHYLPIKQIPLDVLDKANQINRSLEMKSSLYTLDFIVSNSGNSYLLEGNSGPGLNWDPDNDRDKFESKKLIDMIVGELSERSMAF